MTHTLELPENIERVLEATARRRGGGLDVLLLDLVAREAASEESAEAARLAAVRRGRGMFKGNGHETDDFMRERREEGLQEMARDRLTAARQNARALFSIPARCSLSCSTRPARTL